MEYIDNTQALNLLQSHKVIEVGSRKVVNNLYSNNVWDMDVMLLDNGQALGLEGDGGNVSYWLIETQDFKE